jgi:hypothetical protein
MSSSFRDVQKFARVLGADPALLCEAEANPRIGEPARDTIHTWDEIPDVMTMATPKIDWIAEGLFPRGSVTLIAGEPGSYKSWLALSLLRAVSTGGRFLDRDCKRGDVLFLDRENPLAAIHERLAMLGVESLGSARIWGGWLRDAPPSIGDVRLVQIARERRPVMVFDSLIRFHRADENSATEMAHVMGDLRALANVGATVVALHHRAKSEASRYRGSSDIAGGVDTAFALSRDRQAGLLRLECFKSRYIEEFSMTLRPELANAGDFVVTEAPEAIATRDDAEKLAQTIRENPGRAQSEVLAASSVPRGRARALLTQFDGQLWRSERSSHNAKRFFPLDAATTVEIEV